MARVMLVVLALAAAGSAAAEISVYSPRAAAVSVTIYRDDLALITETREVDLPAHAVTLVFEGVVDRLIAQSAVVTGTDRPLAESNLTYNPLTAASLLEHSIGKAVTLVRTHPATGKVTRTPVTIVSAGEGVVLRSLDGSEAFQCSGLPEHLEFSEVPGDLTSKPILSVRLGAGAAGKRTVQLSYLAHGFGWQSNYVGRLNERGDRMALTGWVTLRNETNISFEGAQVQLVAGTLNLIEADEGGSRSSERYYEDEDQAPGASAFDSIAAEEAEAVANQLTVLRSCYAINVTRAEPPYEEFAAPAPAGRGDDMIQEVMVAAMTVVRESFADYQLYRLPWATDLAARQTKQAVFLEKPRVKVERFYSVKLDDIDVQPSDVSQPPSLMLRWENRTAAGLGEPLPEGRVRIFEPFGATDVFAGEADIEDKPVGLPVELALARAMNVSLEFEQEAQDREDTDDDDRMTVTNSYRFFNGKSVPISVEVRHGLSRYWTRPEVLESNLRAGRKFGDLAWRFRVPPGADQLLRYKLRATSIY